VGESRVGLVQLRHGLGRVWCGGLTTPLDSPGVGGASPTLGLVSRRCSWSVLAKRWPTTSALLLGFCLEKKHKCEGCCVNVSETMK
jgi:hypothetical protein